MSDSSITLWEYMLKSSLKKEKEKEKKRIYAKRNHEYQPYFGLQSPLTKILEVLGKISLLKVKSLNFLSKQFFETL